MERLRGVNFGGWFSQLDAIQEKDPRTFPGVDAHLESFMGKGDFARVKDWGFNHVRLPVDSEIVFDNAESPIRERMEKLDLAIGWAADHSLKLMLDLHRCPGHDFHLGDKRLQKLFSHPEYLQKTKKVWSCLAERYADSAHVILEILNEPVAPDAGIWNRTKDSLCTHVRQYAPQRTIVVGSNMWNIPSEFANLTPFNDDNMLYCFHSYEPLLFTHQHAPWLDYREIKSRRNYPGDYAGGLVRKFNCRQSAGYWDKNRLKQTFAQVLTFRDKHNVPVICNEFGVFAPVPFDAQLLWYRDMLSLFQEEGIGFSVWNYKNLDFGLISVGETLHENLPQYNNPQRLNSALLSLLQKY